MADSLRRKRVVESWTDTPFQYFKYLLANIQTNRNTTELQLNVERSFKEQFQCDEMTTEETFLSIHPSITVQELHAKFLQFEDTEAKTLDFLSPTSKKKAKVVRKNRQDREK